MKLATTAFAVLLCSTAATAQQMNQTGSQATDPLPPKLAESWSRHPAPAGGGALANDDDCSTHTDTIVGTGMFSFDLTGATTGAEGQGNTACDFFSTTGIESDIWFTWTADADGDLRMETCGSSVDTKMAIYDDADVSGGCPTGEPLVCNDDDCSLQSGIDLPGVLNGETFLVQLGTFPGTSSNTVPGNLTIELNGAPGPCDIDDDDCATHTDALVGGGSFCFDLTAATTGAEGQANAACDFFSTLGIESDCWFTWTADMDGLAVMQTCGSTVDTKMAAYDSFSGGCPTGAPVVCNDDDCSLQSLIEFPCANGESFLIQLGTFPGTSSNVEQGTLTISIEEPPTPPCGYKYHDGGSDQGSLGLTNGGQACMLQYFDAENGSDIIKGMNVAYGSPLFAPNINNGAPVILAIWDDPNDDMNPFDAVLLHSQNEVVANADTDIMNSYAIPNVQVNGGFWIGAVITQSAGQFPMPMDGDTPSLGRTWVCGDGTFSFNLANLGANSVPPLETASIGFDVVWLIDATSNGTAYCAGTIGTNYCGPAVPNTTGNSGGILVTGSSNADDENVGLLGYNLPPGNVSLFISSVNTGFISMPGTSCGNICLMGPDIARFKYDAQVVDDAGKVFLQINPFVQLTNPPQPILNGQTWHFQCWHRDADAMPACNNNFTDASTVVFAP